MRIVHLCRTPCAGAIEALSSAIRDYTEHESRVINGGGRVNSLQFSHDLVFGDSGIFPVLSRADVLVFHQNMNDEAPPFLDFMTGDPHKRSFGFFHSHPDACDRTMYDRGKPCFVIAQYQALLWPKAKPVRNVIRFERSDWPDRDAERAKHRQDDKVWIGYAPTFRQSQKDETAGSSAWHHSKGYDVTMPVLEELDARHPEVEVMIFEGMSYDTCIRGKALCDILIDEVVTGSYHRNTLEGLALGIPTVVHISPEVHGVMVREAGANDVPVVHAEAGTLSERLSWLVSMDAGKRRKLGNAGRDWMVRHWHPRDIAQGFCASLAGAREWSRT